VQSESERINQDEKPCEENSMIDFELTSADEKILDSAHQQAIIGQRYARYFDKH